MDKLEGEISQGERRDRDRMVAVRAMIKEAGSMASVDRMVSALTGGWLPRAL